MIYLSKGDGTIFRNSFDRKIYKSNKTLLVEDTDFEVLDNNFYTGTVLKNIITLTLEEGETNPFSTGDNVVICEPDGIYRINVVSNVGINKIEFINAILRDGSISIRYNGDKIVLKDIEDGIYTFSDNSSIIIASTFFNIEVPINILMVRVPEMFKMKVDIKSNLEAAKISVLSDFNSDYTSFQMIDISQLTELLILKLKIFYQQNEDNLRYTEDYSKYFKKAISSIKSDNGNLNKTPDTSNMYDDYVIDAYGRKIYTGNRNSNNNLGINTTISWGAR